MTEPLTTGRLVHVDPNSLSIETNVRTEASITKQFVASIKENGVLVPIVAVADEDGVQLRVRAGQRRTLAAREAGLATVPVYVTDADIDTATRVVQQITENDQRLALDAVDRVKGIQALLDTGLSMTKVAKRLAVSAERVKQSRAVAGSAVAMDALHERVATLAEAAGIAEFEDDPEAVARLLHAAGRNYFDHELERLRRAREEAAELARAAQVYVEQGYTVLDAYPGFDGTNVPLRHLLTADGKGGRRVGGDRPAALVGDSGHRGGVLRRRGQPCRRDHDRLVDGGRPGGDTGGRNGARRLCGGKDRALDRGVLLPRSGGCRADGQQEVRQDGRGGGGAA